MKRSQARERYLIITIVMVCLMMALLIRLFVLTGIQHDKWEKSAESQNTRQITIQAPRGQILDRNGRVIAGNKEAFYVTFNASDLKTSEINQSAYDLITLLEKNGDSYIDNFPIKIDENGELYYSYDRDKSNYLISLGLGDDATLEEAFTVCRNKNGVDPELSNEEALTYLQNELGIWPPISIAKMSWNYDLKKVAFLKKYGLYNKETYAKTGEKVYDIPAKEAFERLRGIYSISTSLSNLEARKIFIIREEIKNNNYSKYISLTISQDVSNETVAIVSELGEELKGVSVCEGLIRYYPNGNLASHIIGYMGSISDSQYEEYVVNKGYKATDLIGKEGIELTMEKYLHGQDGYKTILVNSSGEYVETIEEVDPIPGQDVYLTIDIDLQQVAEDALEQSVYCVSEDKLFESKYGQVKLNTYKNCDSGAIVVMDVDTGEVLAMASYPDYDPNIFADGISASDWASVQSTNPRDPIAATPLYNIATQGSFQPGSTFKPITAITALQCGLNYKQQIYDEGYIEIGGRIFGCVQWNSDQTTHGTENLITGIKNSCNYYFYCIATGYDWSRNRSLNYREQITNAKIMDMAKEFGLGEKTGIEIYESITSIASEEKKLKSMKTSCYNYLYSNRDRYWPNSTVLNPDKLVAEINTIVSWIDENPSRDEIASRIKKNTTIEPELIEKVVDVIKYSYFNQAKWNNGDTFNLAIGQGDNSYTPLQMARYVAALGNSGLRNEATIIKAISGVSDIKAELGKGEPYQIAVTQEEIDIVIQGMVEVTRGSIKRTFKNFPVTVACKTGTAQRSGYINPKDEVAYVKKYLKKIAKDTTWAEVEAKMKELMAENPRLYPTENDAVDKALMLCSKKNLTQNDIDQYKETYDHFSWLVALAPADEPEIAVVGMLIKGGNSINSSPMVREVIGEYLGVDKVTIVEELDLLRGDN